MKYFTNIVKCCKGCHPLAYELLCQLVQPVCYSERMVCMIIITNIIIITSIIVITTVNF